MKVISDISKLQVAAEIMTVLSQMNLSQYLDSGGSGFNMKSNINQKGYDRLLIVCC